VSEPRPPSLNRISATARRTAGIGVALAVLCASPAFAAVAASNSFPGTKVATPPKFDPALSDPEWQQALTATDFENLTTRTPAKLKTTAYLLYDDKNLYVAFHVEQQGVPIHAQQTTNNVGFGQDDLVGVGFDVSGAGSSVYYFETTPRGVRYQQCVESSRYNPEWKAEAAVDGSSWVAMLTIPLHDLRAAGGKDKSWRINFIRNVAGVAEHYTWAYDGLMQDGQPPNWPALTDARWWPTWSGLDIAATAARPKPRAEIYGLASMGADRDIFQQPNLTYAPEPVRNVGLDFVYPLTSTIAAVGTLNPDFSNVEIDQQTIVPQEFPRALAEYRPFFAQGAQYFTNASWASGGPILPANQIWYSPNIGTFDRGLKVEGTFGYQSIGAMTIRGTTPGQEFDDQVFGFKHALPNRTFLYWVNSVLAHEPVGNDSTLETGIAGRNLKTGFVWGYDQVVEQYVLATTPDTYAYSRAGFIDVHKPNYEWMIQYQDISPGYGPLAGFTNVNDERGGSFGTDFTTTALDLKNWTGYFAVDRYLTHAGTVHAADFFGTTDLYTKGLIHLNLTQATSSLDDPVLTGGVMLPFNESSFTLGYKDGTPTPVDFTYGAGPFSTFYLQQFNFTTSRPLGTHFNIAFTYAGTHERSIEMGVNGQILRSIGVGESLGPTTNVTLALRGINGTGGFAQPGVNFAAGLHHQFKNGSEVYANWGSPSSPVTLDRFILKYVWRIGGGAGT